MKKDDILYIFFHLRKCGGVTFHTHIDKNFKPEEIISLYEGYRTYDVTKRSWEYTENREDGERYIESLSEEQKSKVKVIYGRDYHYGIHRHFKQTARYIAFVREPVSRCISHYNFHRKVAETESSEAELFLSETRKKIQRQTYDEMFQNGEPVTFDHWITNRAQADQMVSSLLEHKFIESPEGEISAQDIQRALDKFYFIGLTETYSADANFLYYLLGIPRMFTTENISTKYVSADELKWSESKILSKNKLDRMLYEMVREKNQTFKKSFGLGFYYLPFFSRQIRRVQDLCLLILKRLYAVSAVLKKHSSLYTNFVRIVKSI